MLTCTRRHWLFLHRRQFEYGAEAKLILVKSSFAPRVLSRFLFILYISTTPLCSAMPLYENRKILFWTTVLTTTASPPLPPRLPTATTTLYLQINMKTFHGIHTPYKLDRGALWHSLILHAVARCTTWAISLRSKPLLLNTLKVRL